MASEELCLLGIFGYRKQQYMGLQLPITISLGRILNQVLKYFGEVKGTCKSKGNFLNQHMYTLDNKPDYIYSENALGNFVFILMRNVYFQWICFHFLK